MFIPHNTEQRTDKNTPALARGGMQRMGAGQMMQSYAQRLEGSREVIPSKEKRSNAVCPQKQKKMSRRGF